MQPVARPPACRAPSRDLIILAKLAQHLSFLSVRLTRGLLALLGLERASALMGWCWRVGAPLTERHPRAMAQLEAALPMLAVSARRQIIARMWEGLGRTFAEGLLLDRLMAQSGRITVEDEALFADLCASRADGAGIVFVSLHSGNWEALGIPLAKAGMNVAGLYQPVQNPMLEADLLAQRADLYRAGMISKGSHGMKRIVRLLRNGDAVAMLADQREARRGLMVPFFGLDAPSTPLPASLALRTGARLVLARCKRVGPVRFAIELEELQVEASGEHDDDVERLTCAIHARFEEWIRQRPAEWMWAHRRWAREAREPST